MRRKKHAQIVTVLRAIQDLNWFARWIHQHQGDMRLPVLVGEIAPCFGFDIRDNVVQRLRVNTLERPARFLLKCRTQRTARVMDLHHSWNALPHPADILFACGGANRADRKAASTDQHDGSDHPLA